MRSTVSGPPICLSTSASADHLTPSLTDPHPLTSAFSMVMLARQLLRRLCSENKSIDAMFYKENSSKFVHINELLGARKSVERK